jgi:hypothetical protein
VIVSDTKDGSAGIGQFAATELSRYLGAITSANFSVVSRSNDTHIIVLRSANTRSDEYSVRHRGDNLVIQGQSPRATLLGVYAFLERLGCQWLAPEFAFYGGKAEQVPKNRTLSYSLADFSSRPAFQVRRINVEEGLSFDSLTLSALVEWMPKAKLNTLSIPMNYSGNGRVQWDKWRIALAPELRKRGIDIEVGGHGYQNFLSATANGEFATHTEWFGRDSTCNTSRDPRVVFNSQNEQARSFVNHQVETYLEARPEIGIFEFWPPDGALWSACREQSGESASERQAVLLNEAAKMTAMHGVRLETISYGEVEDPPVQHRLAPEIMVDVCPISQNFNVSIDDPAGLNNARYAALIRRWRSERTGYLGICSYYRRYAWLSLPVVLPHYMQHDMQWYASVPVQGISTFAEPGDWFTYELNHYAFARLAWDPRIDVDSLVRAYTSARYGRAAPLAARTLVTLENVVRRVSSIQNVAAPSPAQRISAGRELTLRQEELRRELQQHADSPMLVNLKFMVDYAIRDLAIQEARVAGDTSSVLHMVDSLTDFMTQNQGRGVFLLTRNNDRARIRRHYGIKVSA